MYYRNSDAVAVIFDVSDRESFSQVKSWINGNCKFIDLCKMLTYVLKIKKQVS